MLEIDLAVGFGVGDILALPGGLLDKLVRHEKAHGVMGYGDLQVVTAGRIAFVGTREACGVSAIGEVLQDWRVEIASGMKSVQASRKAILAANERDSRG